jgi:catechol 2,3-dioxygenase-like lactoylglutathione lyase family enzyme
MARLSRSIPALPVRDVPRAVEHYRDHLGFTPRHVDRAFAVLERDDVLLHLWGADDDAWPERDDLHERPVRSGAESFLAGTASCRIEVDDVDALYPQLAEAGVLHPTSADGVHATDFGTREFATLDPDGNLVEFFTRTARSG